jgi:hypothetical protein
MTKKRILEGLLLKKIKKVLKLKLLAINAMR